MRKRIFVLLLLSPSTHTPHFISSLSFTIVDYDYEFYGYSDYRGGYSEPYYDDYFRSYDGEFLFDYAPTNSGATPITVARNIRNNSVGPVNIPYKNQTNQWSKNSILRPTTTIKTTFDQDI